MEVVDDDVAARREAPENVRERKVLSKREKGDGRACQPEHTCQCGPRLAEAGGRPESLVWRCRGASKLEGNRAKASGRLFFFSREEARVECVECVEHRLVGVGVDVDEGEAVGLSSEQVGE